MALQSCLTISMEQVRSRPVLDMQRSRATRNSIRASLLMHIIKYRSWQEANTPTRCSATPHRPAICAATPPTALPARSVRASIHPTTRTQTLNPFRNSCKSVSVCLRIVTEARRHAPKKQSIRSGSRPTSALRNATTSPRTETVMSAANRMVKGK